MKLRRASGPRRLVSLTPLVDVMLILLIFFMVTSTYLDLDMVPVVETTEDAPGRPAGPSRTQLVRIADDGTIILGGRALSGAALEAALSQAAAEDRRLLVLPSGNASLQSLVSLLEAAAGADAGPVQVVRVEG